MNELIYKDWDEDPPSIITFSRPMASAPNLHLSGSGTARMSLESYVKDLERDTKNQTGDYFAYVMKGSREEADTYHLVTWQVCIPQDNTYEAVIIKYYAPINHYLTLKKYFGEDSAQEYLDEIRARDAVINALAEALD
jgi:hypothetical protein